MISTPASAGGARRRERGAAAGRAALGLANAGALAFALLAAGAAPAAAQVTPTEATVSITAGSATEPDSTKVGDLTFTISLSAASIEGKESVRIIDAGTGTATSGTDYEALPSGDTDDEGKPIPGGRPLEIISWAIGETSKTFTVTMIGDDLDEPNETVVLSLTGVSGAVISSTAGSATGTITDNDATPTVTLSLSPSSIAESGETDSSTVTASLDARSSVETTVTVSAAPGTDTVAADYTLSTETTLTIAADATSSTGTVTITANDNALDEPDKTVTVSGTATNTVGITNPANVALTITDDDPAPSLSISSPTVTEGDSATVTLTYTVTLGAASGRQVTVDYADAGTGTATSGTDYEALTSGTLTFAAGETSKEITVTVNGDTDTEPHETVVVRLSGASNATIASADATGTITNDDGPPTLSLSLSPAVISESGANNTSTVTASLSWTSTSVTTITVSAAAGTNADATNFTLSADPRLTIAAGSTTSTGTVTVAAVDDADDEANRTVLVSGSVTNTEGVADPPSETLTIVDDDGLPGLYLDSPSVDEGDSGAANLDFTVTLSPASGSAVTVNYADAGTGTATSGTDYTAVTGGALSFAANETSKTVTVSVTGDTRDEPDETVVLNLSGASGALIGAATGTGTIRDDDDSSGLSITSETVAEGDTGSTDLDFTVTLNPASDRTVTVSYEDAGTGTAASGTDYTAVSSGALTFAPGETSKTVTVSVTGDASDEDAETVVLTLTGASGARIATASVAGTITDDDAPPTLTIADARVAEGDSGATNLNFTVALSEVSGKTVSVQYAEATGGTATVGTDYTALTAGTLTIAAGSASGTVTVSVTGDRLDEANETVLVQLSNPQNATISDGSATGTIVDDDGKPQAILHLSSASIIEGRGTVTITASLDRSTTAATTITVSATAGANTQANDFTLSTTRTLTIAAGATTSTGTVRLGTTSDTEDEPNQSVVVSGTVSDPGRVTHPTSVTLTIVDNDGSPKFTIDSPRVTEGDASTVQMNFTVSRSPPSADRAQVSFRVVTASGTATLGTDYNRVTPGTVSFAAWVEQQQLTVTIRGDTLDEDDETVVMEILNPQGATIETGTGTGTIVDNDDGPTVSISSPRVTEGDTGTTNLDFTVSLNPASARAIHVDWSDNGGGTATQRGLGTVTSDTDYENVGGSAATLQFAAGETRKTIRVQVRGDTKDEPDETVVITLSSLVVGGGVVVNGTGIGTIVDDDAPPSLSITSPTVAEGDSATTNLTYTASLSAASGRTITVGYEDTGDGDATSGTDYTALPAGTLTFEEDQTSREITVSVLGDRLDESDETIEVALKNPANASLGAAATGTGTITDDDPTPTLSISSPSVTEGADGATTDLTFTVTLSAASGREVTVEYEDTGDGDAASGTDYTALPDGDLTFAAGETSKEITVSVNGDALDENDETVEVELKNPTNAALGTDATGTGTITDDDATPQATLTLTPDSISESGTGNSTTVTAALDVPSSVETTITVAAAAGENAAPADFTLSAAPTLTIVAGATTSTGTVTVTAVDDADDTPNKLVTVSGSVDNAVGVTAPAARTLTIVDDDGLSGVYLDDPVAGESDGVLTFTVTVSPATASAVEVDYADAGTGTAVSGTDYAAIPSGRLSFAANETTKTFGVSLTPDTLDENDETIEISLSGVTGASIGDGTGTGTITDDDASPTLSVESPTVAEGDVGPANLTFAVTLSTVSGRAVTVDYADAGTGTATAGNDYTAISGTLTFAPGQTTAVFTVPVVGDETDEANETVVMELSNAFGAEIATGTGTGTITDDDGVPTLSIDSPSVAEGDSGSTDLDFTVTLSVPSQQQVTVNYAEGSGGTATAGTDYTALAAGTLTFASGETAKAITIQVTGDATDEPDETVRVLLSSAANATIVSGTGTGTITDDDASPVARLHLSPTAITENAQSSTVTATLSRASTAETTITVGAAAGAGAVTADFSLSASPTLTIAAGATTSTGTVTITSVNNSVDSSNKSVTVSGTASNTRGVTNPANVTLTLIDDDGAPMITVDSPTVLEGDSGNTRVTFTLTLSPASTSSVNVSYADAGSGTATRGSDYTSIQAGGATFSPGTTTATVTTDVIGDTADESDETIVLRLAGTNLATTTATATILDDDEPPRVSLALSPASIGESGAANRSAVTATLDRASARTTTITVAAAAGANADASDFSLSSNPVLTIAAGATTSTGTVTITAQDDTQDEPAQRVGVSGTAANSLGVAQPAPRTLTITDDDDPPTLTIDSPAVNEGDSGSATLTYTVSLSPASGRTVRVNYADAGTGSARSGTDYTAITPATLTFAPGETTKTLAVSVTGDTTDEPDETVRVMLSNPRNATVTTGTGSGTITDDDDAPQVTLALSRNPITESGTTNNATVTATLDRASSEPTTITVTATAGAGAEDADFTLSMNRTLTILAGDTSSAGTVTITAVDNSLDEANKSVTVAASAVNTLGITNPTSLTLTINDDDDSPSLSIDSPSAVTEGDSGTVDITFTVSLSAASGQQVTVAYADAGTGTATSGADYEAITAGTLTFAAGDTSKEVTVRAKGDRADEPNETVIVSLSSAANATISTASGTGTINDDDPAPAVTLSLSRTSIAESGATNSTTVTASLDRPSSHATSITVGAAAGTGAVTADYSVSANTALTIAAGATASTGTVTITAVDNSEDEPDKSVTVSGSASNSQGITNPSNVTLTITDDDAPPSLSINSPSVTEGDSGSANLTFTVSLGAASGKVVEVDYADAGTGTATSGTDYTAVTAGTLTFAVGDTSKTVTVAVTGDTIDENDETIVLRLSNASNAGISTADGTGTITDNDGPPTVTLVLTPTSIAESGTTNSSRVTATLDKTSIADTVVTVSAAAGTNAVAGHFLLSTARTLTITAGQTASRSADLVTVTAVDNSTDEPSRSVTVSGTATNTQGVTNPGNQTLTITDDDATPKVTLSLSPTSIAESGMTNASTVTASLDRPSSAATTITVSATAGAGAVTADFSLSSTTTLTIAAGATTSTGTVTITAQDNDTDAPDKSVTVSGSASNNQGITDPDSVTLTITDDDAAPTVTLALSRTSITESGATNSTTVTASLDRASSAATTITVSATAGAGAVAADFSLSSTTSLSIAAGATTSTGTVTITAVNNAVDEPDKTVVVKGDATNTQGVTDPSDVNLTITDDDGPPSLSIDDPSVDEGDSGAADLRFTVRLSAASGQPVTVAYAEGSGGTATRNTDYTGLTAGTLTFAAGDTSETITVSVTGDTVDEPDETVKVTLSGATNATIGTATGTGTITNDEANPTVTLSLTPTSIDESGSTNSSRVRASLDHASSANTTVTVAAAAGADTEATDFSLSTANTLTILAGQTTSRNAEVVTIRAVNNSTDEPDKTVTVSGSASNANGVTNPSSVSLTIEDDDGPPSLSLDSPSVAEGDSGSANLVFTARLSAVSGHQVTVDYEEVSGTGAGTATSGTDYTALASGTLTFSAGDTSRTITVSVTGDTTDEPNETVRVTLSSATNATIGTATGTGTITDDDDAPTVTLALSRTSIAESGTTNSSTVTASLDHASSAETVITVSAAAGADTVVGDFSLSSNAKLTIAAGGTSSTGTVTITAVDNTTDEPDKTVTVSGAAVNSQGVTDPSTVDLTITDDDAAPSLAIASPTVTEGDSGSTTMTFAVTLDAASGKQVTVDYAEVSGATAGTATSGTDYTALTAGTLTFAVGDTSENIAVSITGDTTDEPNETVKVTLGNAGNASIGTATGTGTITDDDDAPKVSLSLSRTSIAESGSTNSATVTASLPHPSSEATTITVAASPGTNAVTADFTLSSNAKLTIAAGATSSTGEVTVTANDNDTDEPNKSVTVSGSAVNSQGITDPDDVTLTITDDDAPPSLSINSPSVTEGNTGSVNLTFTVTLSAASDYAVEVAYAETTGGTATAGTDYTALTAGTLSIAAGDTSATFTVSVTGDTTDEDDETVRVTLSSPVRATISTGTGTGTITDDDGEPALSISSPSVAEGTGGTTNLTYTVSLTPASGRQVRVAYADAGTGAAVSGTDYRAVTGRTLTFAAGDTSETFTVSVIGDNSDEPDETVVMQLSGAVNASISTATGTGTITDDDGEPALSIDSPLAPEGTGGDEALVFTVRLSPVSGKTVSVNYRDAGTGTATVPDDYAAVAPGSLSFPPGTTSRTIEVAMVTDPDIEPDETVVLEIHTPNNATIGTASGTGTIADDDAPVASEPEGGGGGGGGGSSTTPELSISSPQVTERDGESVDLVFTVSLSAAASQRVTVRYEVLASGSAAAGSDYTAIAAGTLTFQPGQTRRRITVTVAGDDEPEEDETIVVRLSGAEGADLGQATGVGTIVDDDGPTGSAPRFLSEVAARSYRVGSPIEPLLLPEATDGEAPLTYALSPALPPGLSLALARRTITGAPTAARDGREYRWTATDTDGDAVTTTFRITILPDRKPSFGEQVGPELRYRVGYAITPVTLPAATGGDGALTYGITPAPPPGLAFAADTRTLSGTPGAARARTVHTLTATDEDGDAAELRFAITTIAAVTLDGIRISSRPANGHTYFVGETIEIEAVFSEPVAPLVQDARMTLTLGDRPRTVGRSATAGGSLRFRYRVEAADQDPDGIGLPANPLTVELAAGRASDEIETDHPGLPDQPGHRVDGAPQAVGALPAITLTLGGEPARVEVAAAFHGATRYAAVSSAPRVAAVTMDDEAVVVTPVGEGEATVTVTGTNPGGSAEQQFAVTVTTARAEREVVEHAFAGLGRSLLGSASATVGRRLASGGTGGGAPAEEGEAADEVLFTGLPTDDRLRLEEALRTSRNFSLSARRSGGLRWTVWGAGDLGSFSGETATGPENAYEGRPLTSWLGVDVSGGRLLAGLSVSRTDADAEYAFADPSSGAAGTGRLDASLMQVHPYLRWSPGTRTTVWGHGGFGRGSATLTRSVAAGAEESDLNLMMGFAGLRRMLGSAGAGSFALRADFGGARLAAADGASVLRDLSTTVYRGRLGVEWRREFGPAAPFLEFGGRYDGGAGVTGAGLEVAGGLRVADRRSRLGVEARGRILALHSAAGYRERGLSLAARFTPRGNDRGLQVELRPAWGAPAQGAQTLWQDASGGDLAGLAREAAGDRSMAARLGYGLGLLTPFTEMTWSDALSRMLRAGLRVGRYGEAIDLEMSGSRQQRPDGHPDYRFHLYGRLRLP